MRGREPAEDQPERTDGGGGGAPGEAMPDGPEPPRGSTSTRAAQSPLSVEWRVYPERLMTDECLINLRTCTPETSAGRGSSQPIRARRHCTPVRTDTTR